MLIVGTKYWLCEIALNFDEKSEAVGLLSHVEGGLTQGY